MDEHQNVGFVYGRVRHFTHSPYIEQVEASPDAAADAANTIERSNRGRRRRKNRESLPSHLRVEMLVDVYDHAYPCCHHALQRIGENVSERLDLAQFRVLVVRRPKYACRACETMVQAPAPARLIEGGLPTEAR